MRSWIHFALFDTTASGRRTLWCSLFLIERHDAIASVWPEIRPLCPSDGWHLLLMYSHLRNSETRVHVVFSTLRSPVTRCVTRESARQFSADSGTSRGPARPRGCIGKWKTIPRNVMRALEAACAGVVAVVGKVLTNQDAFQRNRTINPRNSVRRSVFARAPRPRPPHIFCTVSLRYRPARCPLSVRGVLIKTPVNTPRRFFGVIVFVGGSGGTSPVFVRLGPRRADSGCPAAVSRRGARAAEPPDGRPDDRFKEREKKKTFFFFFFFC